MRDYHKQQLEAIEVNGFFSAIKTILYAWIIIGAVVGSFYLSFACHWG